MVVKVLYAFIADGTVLRPRARRLNIAEVASRVLDDVPVLRPVKLWDYAVRLVLPAEFGVGRIEQQGRQVGQNVHGKEAGEEDEDVVLQGSGQCRNYDQEGGQRED